MSLSCSPFFSPARVEHVNYLSVVKSEPRFFSLESQRLSEKKSGPYFPRVYKAKRFEAAKLVYDERGSSASLHFRVKCYLRFYA